MESNGSLNSHIEEYLDYYCALSHPPGFAILLKGQWGVGKTWFIKNYCDRLKHRGKNYLFVSLYGMEKISDIENSFFQQVHPFFTGERIFITGKIFQECLKGELKIDFDPAQEGACFWNIKSPDIEISQRFREAEQSVLVFDDFERCDIEIESFFGYLNFFVEHLGKKVIIVANENESIVKNHRYPAIKEKLIGKTLELALDLKTALSGLIQTLEDCKSREFLWESMDLIEDLYNKDSHKNLRTLKQIILDFQRILEFLPVKALNQPEILKDILAYLTAFSIEIQRGKLLPQNIHELPNPTNNQSLLLSFKWWQTFFERGVIDTQELEESILNSKYFLKDKVFDWIKLYHFSELDDDELNFYIQKIEAAYQDRTIDKLGELYHIFGILLCFSEGGMYDKSKLEILNDAKQYINYLNDKGSLFPKEVSWNAAFYRPSEPYLGLEFYGKEFQEFNELTNYINEVREKEKIERIPELFEVMCENAKDFCDLISLSNPSRRGKDYIQYYNIPIFKAEHIVEEDFVKRLLKMPQKEQKSIIFALAERYNSKIFNPKLIEELRWLKELRSLLKEEIERKKGKMSAYCLSQYLPYLEAAIEKLELIKAEKAMNPSNLVTMSDD